MAPKKTAQKPPDPQPYDPFSYPRLYPSGWNLDEINVDPAKAAEAKKMQNELSSLPHYQPFHELRTFPSGWDLS